MAMDPHILYIEDEHSMLELARHALKSSGYALTVATSGEQGLTMIRQHKPDVLLLDLMMPDFNGWDVYRELKTDETLSDIPVIVVTAKTPEDDHIIIKGLPPVDEYITKPFDVEHLITSVQNFLH